MKFVNPKYTEVEKILKSNNKIKKILKDSKILFSAKEYDALFGYYKEVDIEDFLNLENDKIYEKLARMLVDNNDYILNNSIKDLVSSEFLLKDIKKEFKMKRLPTESFMWNLFKEYKFNYTNSFFQNNWEKFLPDCDFEEISNNEQAVSFMEAIMCEFDKLDKIITDSKKFNSYSEIPFEYINHLTQLLGLEQGTFFVGSNQEALYRTLAENILDVYSSRGTVASFELMFNFFGLDVDMYYYYFDRRRYFINDENKIELSLPKNMEEKYKGNTRFTFYHYLTSHNPSDNFGDNVLNGEIVSDADMSYPYSLVNFDEFFKDGNSQLSPNDDKLRCVLGYDNYYNNTEEYTGDVYKYFKTNYVRIIPRNKHEGANITYEQSYQISKILDFLMPAFYQKDLHVIVDIGHSVESMSMNYKIDNPDSTFYMLDSEDWFDETDPSHVKAANFIIKNYKEYKASGFEITPKLRNGKPYINSLPVQDENGIWKIGEEYVNAFVVPNSTKKLTISDDYSKHRDHTNVLGKAKILSSLEGEGDSEFEPADLNYSWDFLFDLTEQEFKGFVNSNDNIINYDYVKKALHSIDFDKVATEGQALSVEGDGIATEILQNLMQLHSYAIQKNTNNYSVFKCNISKFKDEQSYSNKLVPVPKEDYKISKENAKLVIGTDFELDGLTYDSDGRCTYKKKDEEVELLPGDYIYVKSYFDGDRNKSDPQSNMVMVMAMEKGSYGYIKLKNTGKKITGGTMLSKALDGTHYYDGNTYKLYKFINHHPIIIDSSHYYGLKECAEYGKLKGDKVSVDWVYEDDSEKFDDLEKLDDDNYILNNYERVINFEGVYNNEPAKRYELSSKAACNNAKDLVLNYLYKERFKRFEDKDFIKSVIDGQSLLDSIRDGDLALSNAINDYIEKTPKDGEVIDLKDILEVMEGDYDFNGRLYTILLEKYRKREILESIGLAITDSTLFPLLEPIYASFDGKETFGYPDRVFYTNTRKFKVLGSNRADDLVIPPDGYSYIVNLEGVNFDKGEVNELYGSQFKYGIYEYPVGIGKKTGEVKFKYSNGRLFSNVNLSDKPDAYVYFDKYQTKFSDLIISKPLSSKIITETKELQHLFTSVFDDREFDVCIKNEKDEITYQFQGKGCSGFKKSLLEGKDVKVS